MNTKDLLKFDVRANFQLRHPVTLVFTTKNDRLDSSMGSSVRQLSFRHDFIRESAMLFRVTVLVFDISLHNLIPLETWFLKWTFKIIQPRRRFIYCARIG